MREGMHHDDGTSEKWKGRWEEVRGHVKQKWGELTDDDLDQIEGKRDVLIGKIHQKYGGMREDIERDLNEMWPAA